MIRRPRTRLLALAVIASAAASEAQDAPLYDVDYPAALAQRDLVWDSVPADWWSGAFVGNGGAGAMIYGDGDHALHFELGHTDVWDHQPEGGLGAMRAGKTRLLIGGLALHTHGVIVSGDARLDLWNGEARGTIATTDGTLRWRAFTHHGQDLIAIELFTTGAESGATWSFDAAPARSPWGNDPPRPNAPAVITVEVVGGRTLHAATQTLVAGGGYSTVYAENAVSADHRVMLAAIAWDPAGTSAHDRATALVTQGHATGIGALGTTHRAGWNAFYPQSHLEIPDAALDRFWWQQMYKLGSATRADRAVYDLLGPWPRTTRWPGLWWNLNVQMAYWPVYASNHLDLGESLTRSLDRARRSGALAENEPVEAFRVDSGALATTSTPDMRSAYPLIEHCDLLWSVHNAWLQYRYSMDDAMLRTQLVPSLKQAVAYYLHRLTDAPVPGRLNIPVARSPEYDVMGPNPTIDVALLRWGLGALIDADTRLALHDPDRARWEDTLRRLVDLPVDDTGLLIATGVPLGHTHREPAHLMPIYPLHVLSWDDPAHRALIARSVGRWTRDPTVGINANATDRSGYSFAWAASLFASMGRGDDALESLHTAIGTLTADTGVTPNTFYRDGGHATSETPLGVAAAIQELLLQSWGGRLRVFPAVPTAWRDARFRDLRGEGAFLVSAVRQGGVTRSVRIASLAGEPCRVVSDLPWPWHADGARVFHVTRDAAGVVTVDLQRGETVVFTHAMPDVSEAEAGVDLGLTPVHATGGCTTGPARPQGLGVFVALGLLGLRGRRRMLRRERPRAPGR